jgi:cytochrome c553
MILSALVLVSGCGSSGGGPDSAGRRLFTAEGCAGCHTLAASGATGTVGPNLDQLKPALRDVEAKVTLGGNGMPSFAKRLSRADIAAVGRYVESAAASTPTPGAAPFKPDTTTLASCGPRAGFLCYEHALGNVVYRSGARVAIADLQAALVTTEPVRADCHRIAHTMGSAALARYHGDVGRAFLDGSAICASGFYHGILEHAFAGVPRPAIAARARSLCDSVAKTGTPFLQYQCLHGLGHGLMLYSVYDLPFSLATCGQLATTFAESSCTGGVFMENFQTSYGARSPYLRENDLIYPCDAVASNVKYYCYLLITARILPAVGYDWTRAAVACRRSEPAWIATCFQSFGRDASGVAGRSPDRALALCRTAGNMESECLYGVARDIVNSDAGGARAAKLCDMAPAGARAYCFSGVGSVLASLYPDPAKRRGACRSVTRRYVADCIQGAGLPPGAGRTH